MSNANSRKRQHPDKEDCHDTRMDDSDKLVDDDDDPVDSSYELNISGFLEDHDKYLLEGIPCGSGLEISRSSRDLDMEISHQLSCSENSVIGQDIVNSSFANDDSASNKTADHVKVCEQISSPTKGQSLTGEVGSLNIDSHFQEIESNTAMVIRRLDFNNLFPRVSDKHVNQNQEGVQSDRNENDKENDELNEMWQNLPNDMNGCRQMNHHFSSSPWKKAEFAVALPETISPIDSEESDSEASVTSASDSDRDRDSDANSVDLDMCNLNESILDLVLEQRGNIDVSLDDDDDGIVHEKKDTLAKAMLLNDIKIHDEKDLSVNEGILLIMNLYIKNQMTKAGLHRAIESICEFLPVNHNLPSSAHRILSYIEGLAPSVNYDIHYYCEKCLFYHGTSNLGECNICHCTDFGYFYNFAVDEVIKYLFESRNLAEVMDSKKSNDSSSLKDLMDGSVYKALNIDRNRYDVNIILNSDGVRIRKTSESELWIVLATIAEVPIHLQKLYMIVLAVWYGPQKPDMNVFLKPFASKMQILDKQGVVWINPSNGMVQESNVRLPVVVCDAPARAMIQNILYFNGRYGCNVCEIKTVKSAPILDKKRIRIYPYKHTITLRTEARMLQQASRVGVRGHVKGVKGPSVLSVIPSLDISICMVPEYMHSVLLGVVKQILILWTQKKGCPQVKVNVSEIDVFLGTIKHPDFVHRIQRQLKCIKYWKASDFLYFLLYESLPVLSEYLPVEKLQHFMLLVKGIFTFLKSSITREEIYEADLLLKLFVNNFANLYSDREMTHNVHQLCHLGLCVSRFGPLFSYSAFPFEDMNGLVAKKTHGTNFVDKEIVRNIKICQGIQILDGIVNGPKQTKSSISSCQFLGSDICIPLSREDIVMLGDDSPKIYSRAKICCVYVRGAQETENSKPLCDVYR